MVSYSHSLISNKFTIIWNQAYLVFDHVYTEALHQWARLIKYTENENRIVEIKSAKKIKWMQLSVAINHPIEIDPILYRTIFYFTQNSILLCIWLSMPIVNFVEIAHWMDIKGYWIFWSFLEWIIKGTNKTVHMVESMLITRGIQYSPLLPSGMGTVVGHEYRTPRKKFNPAKPF